MRLADRVDVLTADGYYDDFGNWTEDWTNPTVVATVPAWVGHTTVAVVSEPNRQALVEELRAVIEPRELDAATHRVRWRGVTYQVDGPPMVRRRNGRDHHLTLQLKLVSG